MAPERGPIGTMAHRRLRTVWSRTLVALCAAPLFWTVSLADAQTGRRPKKDPCDPSYVPAKGEAPATCPGVKDVPLVPAQSEAAPSQAALAPTPPPVQRKTRQLRGANTSDRAVVNNPGFRMNANGGSKIFVQIHGKPTVRQFVTRSGVTYVLSNARVPVRNNRHPLMTQYFNTPVADARLRQYKDDVHLQIDLRASAAPTTKLIELVKDKVVMLEVSFAPGNYYQYIPTTGPRRQRRGNTKSYTGTTPPPGSRATRGSRQRDTGGSSSRSSVLGPPAP